MKDEKLPGIRKSTHGMKHGIWIDFKAVKIDGRTALAKAINLMRSELTKHVGGKPSIAEALIIERACHKAIKCYIYETNSFSDGEQGSKDHYLALCNSLRLDLQALGLKPKEATKVLDLEDYLNTKHRGRSKAKDGL